MIQKERWDGEKTECLCTDRTERQEKTEGELCALRENVRLTRDRNNLFKTVTNLWEI